MSRTYRKPMQSIKIGRRAGAKQYRNGKLRDGALQHAASSCSNHGGCPICEGNRLHKHKRHEPIVE